MFAGQELDGLAFPPGELLDDATGFGGAAVCEASLQERYSGLE